MKARLWLGISLRDFSNQRWIIPFLFWNILAPGSFQTGLVQTGSVGNSIGSGFGPASGSTPKKWNHYKWFLTIIKLLFQKLFLPYHRHQFLSIHIANQLLLIRLTTIVMLIINLSIMFNLRASRHLFKNSFI